MFDLSKGSYYANPQYDRPVEDEELIQKYITFIHPNIWPTDDLPEFEPAFKTLGQLIVQVGLLIAYQCDNYVKKQCPSYEDGKLERIIRNSLCCKARLLNYYPIAQESLTAAGDHHDPFSSWCGWHNDHGSLTGLISAQFFDASGNAIANADPQAGVHWMTN